MTYSNKSGMGNCRINTKVWLPDATSDQNDATSDPTLFRRGREFGFLKTDEFRVDNTGKIV
jgi:hypothetical protein